MSWKDYLMYVARGDARELHSKTPETPPSGYVRLAYATQVPPEAQGPNYLYIRPEWVKELHAPQPDHPAWVSWACQPGRGQRCWAKIDAESYRALALACEGQRLQLAFF